MVNALFIVIVVVSALWVYWDATGNKVGKVPGAGGMFNLSAGAWSVVTLFLWIIAFPAYLIKRSALIERANSQPVEVKGRVVKMAILAVIGGLLVLGSLADMFIEPPSDQRKAASLPPPAAKAMPAAPAPSAGKPKPAPQEAVTSGAGETKKLHPSSGKHYSDKELQDLFLVCAFASLSQEERHKAVMSLCEKTVKLHEAGKEAEASKAMQETLKLMLATGMLQKEKEKDDPWQSDIPAKAVALNKEGKELHYKAGGGKATFDAAIEKFKQALAIKPDYYTATRNLAEALSFKGDQKGVADNYRKALAIAEKHDIRDMELYERYANNLSSGGKLPEAKKILQKGLKLDPNNSRLLGARGNIHEQEKDFKSAIAYYERAARGGSSYARERLDELQKRKPETRVAAVTQGAAPAAPTKPAAAPATKAKAAPKPAPAAAPMSGEEPKAKRRGAKRKPAPPPAMAAAPLAPPRTPKYNDVMSAVMFRDRAGTAEALELGLGADRPDSNGVTPLMAAAMNGDAAIVQLLLKHGADPARRGPAGSVLDYAVQSRDSKVTELIRKAGTR